MERIEQPRKRGLSKQQVLFWGILFLLAGMISRAILQNKILQMGNLSSQQLLKVMSASGTAMAAATAALVMQGLETCAIPVFAFLLVNGFENAKGKKRMLLYLLITAVVSEIPYNLAMHGELLYMGSRNPAVAMVIGVAVLYFFHRYDENTFQNVLIKLFVGIASILWMVMLSIDHGVALLVVTIVLWVLRNKKQFRMLFGAVATSACTLISPFYIASAMGILPVHLCRDDEPEDMQFTLYLVYPLLLLAVGVFSKMG